jgi:hypothetical protein
MSKRPVGNSNMYVYESSILYKKKEPRFFSCSFS